MRILIASVGRPRPDSANGVELENYRMADVLALKGHDVLVACITPHEPLPIPGVEVRSYPPGLLPWSLSEQLKADIESWGPDWVLITSVYTPVNNRLASWLGAKGIKYVVKPNGGYGRINEGVHRWRKRPFKILFELPMLNRATTIWASGDHDDIRLYGSRTPVVESPRGLDVPVMGPGDKSEVPCLQGLEDQFVYGFLGRLDPVHKGLDLAIDAFDRVADSGSVFVLVGPVTSSAARRLIASARERRVADRIRFVDGLFGDERDRFLGAIDAFVHLSRWEGGVPNSVTQAAVLARPLLITRHADPSELLYRRAACVRVELDRESVEAGMRVIREMSVEERAEMGRRAAEAVRAEFGWDKMVDAFLAEMATGAVD